MKDLTREAEAKALALRFAFEISVWLGQEGNSGGRFEVAYIATVLASIATGRAKGILEEAFEGCDLLPL